MTPSIAPSSVGSTTLGSVASFRPWSVTILLLASRTAASTTSAIARFAIEALEMRGRHLARPETAQLHAALDLVEPLGDLLGSSVKGTTTRYSRFNPAAAVSVTCIGTTLSRLNIERRCWPRLCWPIFGKTAPLVRAEGFEPPRLSTREPKSRASTNSATPATRRAAPVARLISCADVTATIKIAPVLDRLKPRLASPP